MATTLLQAAIATGAGDAVSGPGKDHTFQAWGATTAATGAATIQVQGSNNGGQSWDLIGTISLTLGTTITSDSFTSADRYTKLRANVTVISGTGAYVSCVMGE